LIDAENRIIGNHETAIAWQGDCSNVNYSYFYAITIGYISEDINRRRSSITTLQTKGTANKFAGYRIQLVKQNCELAQPIMVLIAALNEEEGIGSTISEISERIHPQHILVIDGHSHDKTVEIAKELGAKVIFQDGKGKGDALSKALNFISTNIKYVILTDADFTYPAEFLPEMIQILERMPQVGMVCGNRFSGQAEENAFRGWFYFGNKLLAFAHSLLNGVYLEDPLTGLRAIRAGILRKWSIRSKGFDVEVELNRQVSKQGFETIELPIKYRERLGEKKLKMRHGATILKRIIYETI
jgi:glycosyltransferase involved in cell wall biosynthesis